jgi:hypothetical protein
MSTLKEGLQRSIQPVADCIIGLILNRNCVESRGWLGSTAHHPAVIRSIGICECDLAKEHAV